MVEKRAYSYRVEPREVDFLKRATIMALGDYILHTAGEDADKNGFGVRDLNCSNASWVLTRMALEIIRMPDEYENITVTTWVSNVNRIMTTRNLEVIDGDGNTIAYAITNWAIIDISTRQLLNLTSLIRDPKLADVLPPMEPPRKIASSEHETICEHRVVYSDVDFNCHANSMKYLQWVVDTLPIELLKKKFARLDINFIKESRLGDLLKIAGGTCGGEHCFGIIDETGDTVCRIAFRIE